jgi:hypothetical protein
VQYFSSFVIIKFNQSMNNQNHTQGTAWNGPSGANATEFRKYLPSKAKFVLCSPLNVIN